MFLHFEGQLAADKKAHCSGPEPDGGLDGRMQTHTQSQVHYQRHPEAEAEFERVIPSYSNSCRIANQGLAKLVRTESVRFHTPCSSCIPCERMQSCSRSTQRLARHHGGGTSRIESPKKDVSLFTVSSVLVLPILAGCPAYLAVDNDCSHDECSESWYE